LEVVWGCWGGRGQGLQSESTLCHLSLIKSMGIISVGKVVKRSRMQQLMMDMKVVWINICFLGAHTNDLRSKFVLESPNSRPLKLQLQTARPVCERNYSHNPFTHHLAFVSC
jgi:hypothetical protein